MRAGDQVVVPTSLELWGIGIIERTLPNGRLVVRFSDGQEEHFGPHELEPGTCGGSARRRQHERRRLHR
jgi:hypothetical protein